MSSNRQRFMAIISKWPLILPKKEYDYGYRLREILKNKGETEQIFPGTPAENSRKMDALQRLINDIAKNEFFCNAKVGACGFDSKEIKSMLEKQVKGSKS